MQLERESEPQDWQVFVEAISSITNIAVEELAPTARLVEDLDLDSFALTELIVVLIDEFECDGLAGKLEQGQWEGLTVSELFDSCHAEARAGHRP